MDDLYKETYSYAKEGWIDELSIGFDLDGGGYRFEAADHPIFGLRVNPFGTRAVIWDDPDDDYLGTGVRMGDLTLPLLVFTPNTYDTKWPSRFPGPDEGEEDMVLVASGTFRQNDGHECCAAGGDDSIFQRDDGDYVILDTSGEEHVCDRCHGSGYVTTAGGSWAIYALDEEEE